MLSTRFKVKRTIKKRKRNDSGDELSSSLTLEVDRMETSAILNQLLGAGVLNDNEEYVPKCELSYFNHKSNQIDYKYFLERNVEFDDIKCWLLHQIKNAVCSSQCDSIMIENLSNVVTIIINTTIEYEDFGNATNFSHTEEALSTPIIDAVKTLMESIKKSIIEKKNNEKRSIMAKITLAKYPLSFYKDDSIIEGCKSVVQNLSINNQ